VDSIFMMPHLGVLSTTHPEIAAEVFDKDCLVRLGTAICPVGKGRDGQPVGQLRLELADGSSVDHPIVYGELRRIPLGVGEKARLTVNLKSGFDLGAGKGRPVSAEVEGGLVGIVIDARGRPFEMPTDVITRVKKLTEWIETLNVYSVEYVRHYQEEHPVKAVTAEKGGQTGGLFARIFKR